MTWKRWVCSLGLGLALAGSSVRAEDALPSPPHSGPPVVGAPGCLTPLPSAPTPPLEEKDKAPTPAQDAIQPPTTDAFAQAPPAGGAETGGFNPNMFGDL